MKHIVLFFVSVFVVTFQAQAIPLSADSLKKANTTNTKDELFADVQAGHHSVGYDAAKVDLMGDIALQKKSSHYFITDVYCEDDYDSNGPGSVPNHNVLNVEHTWPQSKFGGVDKGMQKSDLHHLYPADSLLNNIRGNHPFGKVTTSTKPLKCATSKIGTNSQGTTVFEPPPAHRGNVARALFYFSVRYKLTIDSTQEAVLREWNHDDPVDAAEIARNDAIEELQGNRNPFIDNADLADSIDDF